MKMLTKKEMEDAAIRVQEIRLNRKLNDLEKARILRGMREYDLKRKAGYEPYFDGRNWRWLRDRYV